MGAGSKLSQFYNKNKIKIQYQVRRRKFASHASHERFDWNWREAGGNRISLVNLLVEKAGGDKASYLEIGCAANTLFDAVRCKDKVGVDPASGGTHRTTSDEFFRTNTKAFDVIFIDGLHHYEQVHRDAVNAIRCLRPNGWIAFHDFLPRTWREHHVPRLQAQWTGDCWKLAYELSKSRDLDFRILKIDHGVGVLRVSGENPAVVDMKDRLLDAQFDTFARIVPELPLLDWDEGLRWIDGHGG